LRVKVLTELYDALFEIEIEIEISAKTTTIIIKLSSLTGDG